MPFAELLPRVLDSIAAFTSSAFATFLKKLMPSSLPLSLSTGDPTSSFSFPVILTFIFHPKKVDSVELYAPYSTTNYSHYCYGVNSPKTPDGLWIIPSDNSCLRCWEQPVLKLSTGAWWCWTGSNNSGIFQVQKPGAHLLDWLWVWLKRQSTEKKIYATILRVYLPWLLPSNSSLFSSSSLSSSLEELGEFKSLSFLKKLIPTSSPSEERSASSFLLFSADEKIKSSFTLFEFFLNDYSSLGKVCLSNLTNSYSRIEISFLKAVQKKRKLARVIAL